MKTTGEIKNVKDDPVCFECDHYEVCQKWSNAGYLHRDNPKKCSDFTGRSAERIRISALEIVVDEQDKAIQQLEAQVPRWISVEERLPETFENVLVYTKEREILNCHHDSDEWVVNYDGEYAGYDYTITHWMKMPEAPKEDAHETVEPD